MQKNNRYYEEKDQLMRRVGDISQIASIKKYEMTEGRANGIKAFDISTGSGLEFTVLEDKCLDISNFKYKGMNLSFLSKAGMSSSKYFNNLGSEFPRQFLGGMLTTCGLLNVGVSCEDDEFHCIHGRIGNTPAEKVSSAAEWENENYVLRISGEMRESALFKHHLALKRQIETKMGSKSVCIVDELENRGFEPVDFMLLYHFNIGYPLLSKSSKFLAPITKTIPVDDNARESIDSYFSFTDPIDGKPENVYYHTIIQDKDGKCMVALINDELELGIVVRYDANTLPNLVQWKSMMSGDYALGIEPSNCHVAGRVKEKENGTIQSIKPSEKLKYRIQLEVIEGKEELLAIEKEIDVLKRQ